MSVPSLLMQSRWVICASPKTNSFPCLTCLIVLWFSFLSQEGFWDVEEYACGMKYNKNASCVFPWRRPVHPCMVITVVGSVIGKAQAGDALAQRVALFSHEDNSGEKSLWVGITSGLCVWPCLCVHWLTYPGMLLPACFLGVYFLYCTPAATSVWDLPAAFPSRFCYSCNSGTQRMQSFGPHTAHIHFTSVPMLCTNALNIYISVWQHPSTTSAFCNLLNTSFLYSFLQVFSVLLSLKYCGKIGL